MRKFETHKEAEEFFGISWYLIKKKHKVRKCYDLNSGGILKCYIIENK